LLKKDPGRPEASAEEPQKIKEAVHFVCTAFKPTDLTEINSMVLSRCARYIRFQVPCRPEVTVQCGVGGLENQVTIAALAQVPFNLTFHGRRQLSL
jgi:hypothetical protein